MDGNLDDQGQAVGAGSGIGFFESDVELPGVPGWASWLLDLGLRFPAREVEPRRSILIVSTPCDAPAAGLVALGVVMRDLARGAATDEAGHEAGIRTWASQYLQQCQPCRQRCNPKLVRCGFESESTGAIQGPPRPGKTREKPLHVHSFADETLVLEDAKGCREFYPPGDTRLRELHPAGRPRLSTPENKPGIAGQAFTQLRPRWGAAGSNLQRSYSGSCLVGRRTGREATREWLNQSGFILGGHRFPLADMLTVAGWGADSVSRLRYASTRGGACHFDREGADPETAIVDGATELADSLVCPQLRTTSLIAVVPRDSAQDKLENLANTLHEVGENYVITDPAFIETPPPGISISWRLRIP